MEPRNDRGVRRFALQRLGLEERIRSQLLCTRPWGIKHDRLRIPLESPVSTVCLTTVQSGLTGRSPVWAWFCTALQGIS